MTPFTNYIEAQQRQHKRTATSRSIRSIGGYPANWPRCPACGDFAMADHITCGRFDCHEGVEREKASNQHKEGEQ